MLVTPSGMVTLVSALQSSNAPVVDAGDALEGIVTLVSALQFEERARRRCW